MPKLFNLDHQHAVIDHDKPGIAPGESHVFTDAQIKAGLTGSWSEEDPRAGLKAEKAFKKQRDAKAKPAEQDNQPPAESGENKE